MAVFFALKGEAFRKQRMVFCVVELFMSNLRIRCQSFIKSLLNAVRSPAALWFLVAGLLLLPNFLDLHPIRTSSVVLQEEKYNAALAREINTMDELLSAADAYAVISNAPPSSLAYWDNLAEIISQSFSHGYSYYSLSENWIAALSGRLVWQDLAAIVNPEDIIHYPNAACSQQSIVLMECLKRKGIPYRAVMFPHHYAVEAYVGNCWRYFDTNLEPTLPGNTHLLSYTHYQTQGSVPKIYKGILAGGQIDTSLNNPRFGAISVAPAPQAMQFHHITKILSRGLWMVPLFFACWSLVMAYNRRRRRSTRLLIRRVITAHENRQFSGAPLKEWQVDPEGRLARSATLAPKL